MKGLIAIKEAEFNGVKFYCCVDCDEAEYTEFYVKQSEIAPIFGLKEEEGFFRARDLFRVCCNSSLDEETKSKFIDCVFDINADIRENYTKYLKPVYEKFAEVERVVELFLSVKESFRESLGLSPEEFEQLVRRYESDDE